VLSENNKFQDETDFWKISGFGRVWSLTSECFTPSRFQSYRLILKNAKNICREKRSSLFFRAPMKEKWHLESGEKYPSLSASLILKKIIN
jgi:hypothetical protein